MERMPATPPRSPPGGPCDAEWEPHAQPAEPAPAPSHGRAVVCRCLFARRVNAVAAAHLADSLARAGIEVRLVDDLCAEAERRAAWLLEWAAAGELRVIACRPRAIRALFDWMGIRDGVSVVEDIVHLTVEEAARRAGTPPPASSAPVSPSPPAPTDGWMPWFPVVEIACCTGCGQCVEFCWFGVYEAAAGKVRVVRPRNCRPHCPACARICP